MSGVFVRGNLGIDMHRGKRCGYKGKQPCKHEDGHL